MGLRFGLRFDFRNPDLAGTSAADRYAAGLEMVEWADRRGCISVTVSEHHASSDGYLPSPLPMLAAMAARTENIRYMVAALLAPFYDPIRLAEDMVVLDHLSRGRIDLIVGAGYVRSEFEMYGVPVGERARRVTETVQVLKAAFGGEPFEYRGRTVRITPAPYRAGGPALMLGGSSEAAARRAASIADGFLPTVPDVWPAYRDEVIRLGRPDPGPCPTGETETVALAADPDAAWAEMGPFFLHENNAYARWLHDNDGAGPYVEVGGIEELRDSGRYRIVTAEQYVQELQAAPFPFAMFHPLCGGMPPEVAWRSLRLFEEEVLPAFA
ncbi:MAG TPA: LLM class flavin-dependent oxidoreductase [Acidimicrobiales bacterium]|nr:LLM class flavin-dependent oxidoreductase [Acidimicrobiales bacterium]